MGKKKRLTPSHDIYNRIRWDSSLDENEFIIGYLDRFVGIMEMPFNEFENSDVPHHRVRYFAYRSKIVWDRENRIDLLTGAKDFSFLEDSDSDNETDEIIFEKKETEKSMNSKSNLNHEKEENQEEEEEQQKHHQHRPNIVPTGTIFTEEELGEAKEQFNLRLDQIQNHLKQSNLKKFNISLNNPDTNQRIRGCLFGLIWGDVLGSPVEGFPWYKIYELFNNLSLKSSSKSSSKSSVSFRSNQSPPVLPPIKILTAASNYSEIPLDYHDSKFQSSFLQMEDSHKSVVRRFLKKLRPPGLHTAAVQQALAVLACCQQDDRRYIGFDRNRFSKWIAHGYATYAWRKGGNTWIHSCREYIKGTSPEQGGIISQGIDACIRIGPLGALLRNDSIYDLAQTCYECTLTTHRSLITASASFAVAYCIRELCNGTDVNSLRKSLPSIVQEQEDRLAPGIITVWQLKEDVVDREKGTISTVLKRVLDFISLSSFSIFNFHQNGNFNSNTSNNNNNNKSYECQLILYQMRELISNIAQEIMEEMEMIDSKQKQILTFHPNQGQILLGAIHAIACGLLPLNLNNNNNNTDSNNISNNFNPQEILLNIIRLGHDTNAVAAITGSIWGARWGEDWIPSPSIFDEERFESYVHFILDRDHFPVEGEEEFMKHESMLTLWEREYQRSIQKSLNT